MMDSLLLLTIQLFIGSLLLLGGIHKAMDQKRFQTAVDAYLLVPPSYTKLISVLLLSGEVISGIGLLLSSEKFWMVMAVLVFTLYLFVVAYSLVRGQKNVDCGCSLFHRQTSLSVWHLARNIVLLGATLMLLLPEVERTLGVLDFLQSIIAVLGLGLLYLSVDMLLSNRSYLMEEA